MLTKAQIIISYIETNRDRLYKLILILVAAVLVTVWFRKGMMLATAEEGLPFYDPIRTFSLSFSTFYDTGLGLTSVFNIPRLPLHAFTVFLTFFGLVSWQIQSVIFFLIISTALLSFYTLLNDLLVNKNKEISFIATLFYLSNIFTLSQVFTRFIYPLLFLWAYLPLFILLWSRYLKTGKRIYLLYFALSSIIFADVFVILSPAITLWSCAGIYSITLLTLSKEKFKLLKRIIQAGSLWILCNLWWIYPFSQLSGSATSGALNADQNMRSLQEVSAFYPNSELLRLRQSYMNGSNSPYFEHFSSLFVQRVSWFIFAFVVFGIVVAVYKIVKQRVQVELYLFFLLLFLTGWFISKGANPPLGNEFFRFLFEKVSVFQILRNPYEKFGVVYLLGYSFFFSVGLIWITSKFGKLQSTIVVALLILMCGYLVLPLWNGELFKNTYYIKVPSYYETANSYLKEITDEDARIFQLPFLRGSAVVYDWNYRGEDPSEFLFDKASVSRTLSNPFIDEFYLELGDPKIFRENNNYAKLLAIMNVDTIVLHEDLIASGYYQETVNDTRASINNWADVSHKEDFGKLDIFTLPEEKLPGRVYLSAHIKTAKTLQDGFGLIASSDFDPKKDTLSIESQNNRPIDDSKILKLPQFHTNKLSKTHYQISIEKSEAPYIVVLANNFSNSWIARIGKDVQTDHFVVNGFANGWIVDKKGDYTIDVMFKVWPWD